MALTLTNRGTATNNTANTSFNVAVASNCTAGATIVIAIAADNSASQGATNDISNVTDSIGNAWSVVPNTAVVFDNGAASAGVQGSIWHTRQLIGAIQIGTTITVSTASTCTAKTVTFTEITAAAGSYAGLSTGGAKAAGATATAANSGASGTINIGQAAVFAIYIEAGTTQTCTGDSDTTNGSWSTLQYTEIGSTTSGSCIASQGKVQTTANSAQTYDVTLGLSSDYRSSWAIFAETLLPTNANGYYDSTGGWW